MAALQREQRQSLERTIISARAASEAAAHAAIATLAVKDEKPHPQMSEDERRLRRALRAKSRQLGGNEALISDIAYQHWHRMLFARFLAENGLLIYPGSAVAVSLDEVTDLAREEGEPDPWVIAAHFAASMLPGIFRSNEPILEIRFAPEGRQKLEALLNSIPRDTFTADDALGWVYQFWQSEKKREVNKSGRRIGAAELPAVTQLFTDDYMVRFLLENSLGAWWAVRHPRSPLIRRFAYLRLTDQGTPAAGTFNGWPETTADVTVMDPFCGSGHFLTVAFEMLTAMRMEEEETDALQAGNAVIRDNLFGLELDPRCTQIAAFALALSAWKQGGYRELPAPNIACSGIGIGYQPDEWNELARGDGRVEQALAALYGHFRDAPELGSLIDPRRATDHDQLFSVEYEKIGPLLEKALAREGDPETRVAGWAAAGIARAASLLARTYNLVVTNVPYLHRRKQSDRLRRFAEQRFPDARGDLATLCVVRAMAMAGEGSAVALVSPQNWLYLKSFEQMRRYLLAEARWELLAVLGLNAFESIASGFVDIFLGVWTNNSAPDHVMHIVDASSSSSIAEKRSKIISAPLRNVLQRRQYSNPMARIQTRGEVVENYLGGFARSFAGIQTGDTPRYIRSFWEMPDVGSGWELIVSAPASKRPYTGRDQCLWWQGGTGAMVAEPGCYIRGREAWKRRGVAIAQMGALNATLYNGELYDQAAPVIIPNRDGDLPAVWAFLSSTEFEPTLREHYAKSVVTPAAYVQVPFDVERWRHVAENAGPLPEPYSDDPTQWLFEGNPTDTVDPLQVAVARLLGYRWPSQRADALDELGDVDGVVCIPAVAGDPPAVDRLRTLMERAWGEQFFPSLLQDLIGKAEYPRKDSETWLREEFFSAHTKLFHNRPFIWQIWDGRKDGFSALVNYHRLDLRLLDRITYTLLGAWIEVQQEQAKREVFGAAYRIAAAQELQRKLELIAHGDPPYDIYVRWKSLDKQPIGWNPDLNDGVRVNIRPFLTAGILRSKFTINWNKDRGINTDGSERLNNLHPTRAQKEAARREAGRAHR